MPCARTVRADEVNIARPIYVVWETTLRCDHACAHCGSRAGPAAREDELSTKELLEVAAQVPVTPLDVALEAPALIAG